MSGTVLLIAVVALALWAIRAPVPLIAAAILYLSVLTAVFNYADRLQ